MASFRYTPDGDDNLDSKSASDVLQAHTVIHFRPEFEDFDRIQP